MRVVVVGGSGNIGTALLRAMAGTFDFDMVGVSRRAPASDVPWHEIDISRADSDVLLRAAFETADAVVHLAWLLQPSRNIPLLARTNVDGSRRVFDAAVASGVRHLVYLSSVGAYSPGPEDRAVDESWPTDGVPSSSYSTQKAAVERMLDLVVAGDPDMTVTRFRPGLVLQHAAASEIQRYFIGGLAPTAVFDLAARAKLRLLPLPSDLKLQFVHADDVADAIVRALRGTVSGAINLAASPPLTARKLARLTGAVHIPMPAGALRALAATSWRLRLQPTEPGWLDLAMSVPEMDTRRALNELGWLPKHSAQEAVTALLRGLAEGAGAPTPPLVPR
ncbi:NAD-dependent epimerase/dehydratase family protein [Kutzneria kofuensis]|uniref:Nucleoside-diphosphate-sugar epimerase n=1 Tax=Kutzneria kofuensis TaxID=103725 RepID=A0A7W9KR33_9PSEU|nr:NAD-dependent epimerase/dehydratase family protein [Kutzneria kofuensis]MBB5897149.1 nucleoside-diphosphate-sugar epimerase [Kutzneria kofuensis]